MRQLAILAALAGLSVISPAAAQSWSLGVGVEYGDPGYYGPPPGYYGPPPAYYGPPPVYVYEAPPPVYVYEAPPAVYVPAPPPAVPSAVSPDAVFDGLERAGYRQFGPMAFRDGVYKLNAVNRDGERVALEVSALTGAVEREILLGGRQATVAPAPVQAAPRSAPQPAPQTDKDPLVVY
jgi:hypothetical protein